MGVYRRPTTTPVPADETQMGVFRNNAIQLTPPPPPPPAAVAPVNTVAPVISGSATRGSTLTAVAGTWTGNPTPTVTGNWLRNGFAIAGAGNLTYVTVEADEGLPIRYYEAGVNSAGAAAAYSNIITVTAIAGALPTVTTRPSISVALPVAVGSILTRVVGAYGDGTPIAGRWQRDGVDIAGATSATYAVVTADVGHIIRFIETVSNAYGEIEAVSDGLTVVVEVTQTSALQTVIMNLQPDINTVSISRQDGGISTYINSAGTLVRPSNNVSRYHFSSGVFQGLYVEKAASNLCAYGRSIGDVGWSVVGSGVTVTAYDAVAPTGATEATRLQIAATSGFAGLFYQASNASGILRNSMWARSRTGVNQVIWMRHPANGLEEVTVTPTWQRFDKIGQNQDGSNFNIHIIQANNDPVDIELFGVDLCPNGTADDSLIATQSTLGNRPNESLTITLNAAARNGIRDVLVTFDDATTQAFTTQSVGLGWNVNATQLTRRLVRQIEFYTVGTIPPTSAPPPAPPPPPAPSGDMYDVETVIQDMIDPNDSYYYIEAAPNTAEQLFDNNRYAYIAVGRKRGIPGYDPYGASHWPKEFLDDYSIQGQVVGSTIGQQVWYVFGRRAGAPGTSTNTRLQLRNQRFWVWEADGSWTLYSNDANPITGPNSDAWASWHANFRSPGLETYEGISQGSGVYDWKSEASNGGGESIGGVGQGDRYGWAVHGYPIRITRTRNEWINMRGVIQSIEARLILTNGGGTDDRATSGIMSWIGGDWYNNNSSWMNEHKHARLRLVSNDWDIYGNTDIPAATLRANKPPGWT